MSLKVLSRLALLYGAYVVYCYFLQRQVMFPRHLIDMPRGTAEIGLKIDKNRVETGFGKVETWYMPPERESAEHPHPAVIFAHGNGEVIDIWPQPLHHFTRLGFGVLLVEYPGYGRSEGSPSQKSIAETFAAARERLVRRPEIDASRLVYLGRSLGGGAVCDLARRFPPAALILMSSFTATRSFAWRFLVPPIFVRDPFDNLKAVRSYSGPTLIIHGRHDSVVPYRHALKLHRTAPNSTLVTYDSNHNDCPPDWSVFWGDVENFLRKSEILKPVD